MKKLLKSKSYGPWTVNTMHRLQEKSNTSAKKKKKSETHSVSLFMKSKLEHIQS